MKQLMICLGLAVAMSVSASSTEAQNCWTNMFNGKDLTGWTQRNGTATYVVENGTIKGTTTEGSPNSFLCSDKLYSDFELQFEVMVHDSLNSGCQIRSQTKDTPTGRVNGPQVEIEAGPAEAGYVYGEATGGGWLTPDDRRKPTDAMKNGEWNHFRIKADGPRIQTWINGQQIEDLNLIEDLKKNPKLDGKEFVEQYKEGFIGLQVHGIKKGTGPYWVKWRNIKIREL